MSYVVMARAWRPQNFDTVVGQEHIVRTLKNAITANRISHAYLFTGPRGVGKTTTARLLAKAVNCLAPEAGEPCNHCARCEEITSGAATDVIEIDGASNGLVDDARELREKVKYAPVSCRYKVLIIDEVHMMSNAAFNALLKTLEEPPAHTIFILATTESHKIPATIVSRCQRFDFRRIPLKEIVERLEAMTRAENIQADDEALRVVARGADGSLRDAQSLLDQIIAFSGNRITASDAVAVLGLVDIQVFMALVDALAEHAAPRALALVEQLVNAGADLRQFMKDWVDYWRNLVVTRVLGEKAGETLNLAASEMAEVSRQAQLFSLEELTGLAKIVAGTDEELRRTQHPRLLLELLLVRLCAAQRVVSLEALWRQLKNLEARVTALPEKTAAGGEAAFSAVVPAAEKNERENPRPAPGVFSETTAEPDGGLNLTLAEPETSAGDEPEPAGEPVLAADSLEEAAPATPLDRAKAVWPEVLTALGLQNRRVQALLKDVTLSAAEPGWIEVTCLSPYHLTGLEKEESRKVVEAALE
ncbi:MAG: DNA polymerase III subunit gamma/tau, partial [Candidatus Firestonebacteria bacterium]|nr:DNA polymerase III subunit gamma/tau [Candidatus Firestonebacteria bacterium]